MAPYLQTNHIRCPHCGQLYSYPAERSVRFYNFFEGKWRRHSNEETFADALRRLEGNLRLDLPFKIKFVMWI